MRRAGLFVINRDSLDLIVGNQSIKQNPCSHRLSVSPMWQSVNLVSHQRRLSLGSEPVGPSGKVLGWYNISMQADVGLICEPVWPSGKALGW